MGGVLSDMTLLNKRILLHPGMTGASNFLQIVTLVASKSKIEGSSNLCRGLALDFV